MTQRLTRALDERLFSTRPPERVRANHADTVRSHVTESLPESFETGQCTRADILVEAPVGLETCAEPHHLSQTIEDYQLAVRKTRDYHVEAVGTEIDRSE